MEIHNTHNTHNLTCSSSYSQNGKNNESLSLSSNIEYIEKNKPKTRWSKIFKNNSFKTLNNSILNEEEINITNKSYEEKKKSDGNKSKIDKKYINKGKYNKYKKEKNYKKGMKNYSGQNFKILSNGIIVKILNKLKKDNKPTKELNQILLQKDKINRNIQILKNTNTNYEKYNNFHNFVPKFQESQNNSIQMMNIKKPNLSFLTKICKYKNKRFKEIKKLNRSSSAKTKIRMGYKNHPNSFRINPIIIVPKKEKEKPNILFRNKNKNIDNSDNKLYSLSSTSFKKFHANSLYLSKSNNIITNNQLKKRPLSSINIPKSEIHLNIKGSKMDNCDNTKQNESYNILKARPISSMMNSQLNQSDKEQMDNNNEENIYKNADFMNQLKELKNAFEIRDNNNIIINDFNNNCIKQKYNHNLINNYNSNFNTTRVNQNKEIVKSRTLKSERLNKSNPHYLHPKKMLTLYDYENKNKFEDEKQSKQNKYCHNCEYQKHFGNEKNCPLCMTLKEQNKLREEKLSNKNYYFPFKDKYESDFSFQSSFRKDKNLFINFTNEKSMNNSNFYLKYININKDNKSSFNNTFYLNYIYNGQNNSNNIRQKFMRKKLKCKKTKKNGYNIFCKYDAIHKYFE